MMSPWTLPESVEIEGRIYEIRSDYRAIIDILIALDDKELDETEKAQVVLGIFYKNPENIPLTHAQEAVESALQFIDFMNTGEDEKVPVRLMDWKKDAGIIIPAINKVAGREIRTVEYMHWWTFMGMYMEIGESLFSQVLGIRQKKQKKKKLEKWESEFYRKNKAMIDLEVRKETRNKDEQDALRSLLGLGKR